MEPPQEEKQHFAPPGPESQVNIHLQSAGSAPAPGSLGPHAIHEVDGTSYGGGRAKEDGVSSMRRLVQGEGLPPWDEEGGLYNVQGDEGQRPQQGDSWMCDSHLDEYDGSGGGERARGKRRVAWAQSSGGSSSQPPFPPEELAEDDGASPLFGASAEQASSQERGTQSPVVYGEEAVDESTATSVLLAHVVQLRSLWKYEHAQGATLREIIAQKEDETNGCYHELQELEAFVDFLDGTLLSPRNAWGARDLYSAAAELVLNALSGREQRHARLYIVNADAASLTCIDGDEEVVETLGSGVVGFAALTEEALLLGPTDSRLAYCRRPWLWQQHDVIGSALLQRVTDRTGEVLGVVEVLSNEERPVLTAEDAQRVLSLEDHMASIIRFLRVLQGREALCLSALVRRALAALLMSLPHADDCRLYRVDPVNHLLLSDLSPLDEATSPAFSLPLDDKGVGRCLRSTGAMMIPAAVNGRIPAQLWLGLRRQHQLVGDGDDGVGDEELGFAAIQVIHQTGAAKAHGGDGAGGSGSSSFTSHDKVLLEHAGPLLALLVEAHFCLCPLSSSIAAPPSPSHHHQRQEAHVPPPIAWASPVSARRSRTRHQVDVEQPPQTQQVYPGRAPFPPVPQQQSRRPSGGGDTSGIEWRPSSLPSNLGPSDASTTQRLAEALGGDNDIGTALGQAEAVGQQALRCKRVAIWVLEDAGQTLKAPSMMIGPQAARFGFRTEALRGLLGEAVRSGEMVVVEDVSRDGRYMEEVDNPWLVAASGMLVLGVRDRLGRLVGVMHALGAQPFGPDEEQAAMEVVTGLGAMLGRCLQVRALQQRIESVTVEAEANVKHAQSQLEQEMTASKDIIERVRAEASQLKEDKDRHEVLALRAQADMLTLENEKLHLAESLEAQRESNRNLQGEVEQASRQLQELERMRCEDEDHFLSLRASLDTAMKERDELSERAKEVVALRDALEQAMRREKRSAELLRVIDTVLVSSTKGNLSGLLAKLGEVAGQVCAATYHRVFLHDRHKQELVRLPQLEMNNNDDDEEEGGPREGAEGGGLLLPVRFTNSLGIVGCVARTGEAVNVADATRDARFSHQVDGISPNTVPRSMLVLPVWEVVMDGRGRPRRHVVAVLVLCNKGEESAAFTADDEHMMREVLAHVGSAVAWCMENEMHAWESKVSGLEQELENLRQRVTECEVKARALEEEVASRTAQVHRCEEKLADQEGLRGRAEAALQDAATSNETLSLVLKMVSEVDKEVRVRSLTDKLASRLKELFHAQYCAIWLVDKAGKQLRGLLLPGDESKKEGTAIQGTATAPEVVVPMNLGMAGYVARTGELLVIHKDAYKDPRFHPDVDEKAGSVTQSIISGALKDWRGEVVAVLQVLNCTAANEAGFRERDSALFQSLSGPLTAALSRCLQYEATYRSWKESAHKATVDVKRAMEGLGEREKHIRNMDAELTGTHRALKEAQAVIDMHIKVLSSIPAIFLGRASSPHDLASCIHAFEAELARLFDVERVACSLLVPGAKDGPILWYPPNGQVGEARYPLSVGLAGHVARTGEMVVVEEPGKDLRLNRERDEALGLVTRNVLAVAVRDQRGGVMAVLELCNKLMRGAASEGAKPAAFSGQDAEMIRMLMPAMGGALLKLVSRSEERRETEDKMSAGEAELSKLRDTIAELTTQLAAAQEEAKTSSGEQEHLKVTLRRHASLVRWLESLSRETSLDSLVQRVGDFGRQQLQCEQVVLTVVEDDEDVEMGRPGATSAPAQHFLRISCPPPAQSHHHAGVTSPPRIMARSTSPPPQPPLYGRRSTTPPHVSGRSMTPPHNTGTGRRSTSPPPPPASMTNRIMSPPRGGGATSSMSGLTVFGTTSRREAMRMLEEGEQQGEEEDGGVRRVMRCQVKDSMGHIVAILQASHKLVSDGSGADGAFSTADEEMLCEMGRYLGPSMERCMAQAREVADADIRTGESEEQVRELEVRVQERQRTLERVTEELRATQKEVKVLQGRHEEQQDLLRLHQHWAAGGGGGGAGYRGKRPRGDQGRGRDMGEGAAAVGVREDEDDDRWLVVPSTVAHICAIIRERFAAGKVLVLLPDEKEQGSLVMPGTSIRLPQGSSGLVGHVARTGQPVWIENVKTQGRDPKLSNREVDGKAGVQSSTIITCPLLSPSTGDTMGVLQIINRENGSFFSKDDEALAVQFAEQAAVSIEKALTADGQRRVLEEEVQCLSDTIRSAGLVAPSMPSYVNGPTLTHAARAVISEAVGGGASATIMLIDEQKGEVYLPRTSSSPNKEDDMVPISVGEVVSLDPRIWEHVVTNGEPLYVPDHRTTSHLSEFQRQPPPPPEHHPRGCSNRRSPPRPGATTTTSSPLLEDHEAVYLPLLISSSVTPPQQQQAGKAKVLGIVKVTSQGRRSFEAADMRVLSLVCGQVAVSLHACLTCTQALSERTEKTRARHSEEVVRAWHALAEVSSLLHSHCQLPGFLPALLHLSTVKRIHRRRSSKKPARDRGGAGLSSSSSTGPPSLVSFPTVFRRLASALVRCDDVAVVVGTVEAGQVVKGVPARVVNRVAKGREVVTWTTGERGEEERGDEEEEEEEEEVAGGRKGRKSATLEAFEDDDDDEEVVRINAACVPVPAATGGGGDGRAAVLVLVWVVDEEEQQLQEGRPGKEQMAKALAGVVGMALCVVGQRQDEEEEDGEVGVECDKALAQGGAARRQEDYTLPRGPPWQSGEPPRTATPVPSSRVDPTFMALDRLLGVDSVDDLFDAVPAAIASWVTQQARARVFLVDGKKEALWTRVVMTTSGAPHAEGQKEKKHKGKEEEVKEEEKTVTRRAVPLTKGILGHVARSGGHELVCGAAQHMFYDAKVDQPECAVSSESRSTCIFCQHHDHKQQQHHPLDSAAGRRKGWEEYHLGLPRLYLPLRSRTSGEGTAAVVVVEFHTPPNYGHHHHHHHHQPLPRLEHLVARLRKIAPVMEALVTRCLEARRLRCSVEDAEKKVRQAARYEDMLRLSQEVVSQRKVELIALACERSLGPLLCADRVSLFCVDQDRKVLYQVKSNSKERWRAGSSPGIPFGEGIVGYVAATGKVLRLPAEGEAEATAGGGGARQEQHQQKLEQAKSSGGTPVLDLSSGHSIRVSLDGSGYKTQSLVCLPVFHKEGGSGEVSAVLMIQNRQQGLAHFTEQDEVLATRFAGYLAPALRYCRLQEDNFRIGLASRFLEAVLALPDSVLTNLASLCDKLREVLVHTLRVDGARIFFLVKEAQQGGGAAAEAKSSDEVAEGGRQQREAEGEGGGWTLLSPTNEAGGVSVRAEHRIQLGGGSITEASLEQGKAVVVAEVRNDPRYNRSCDKGEYFLGVSPIPKRTSLPGGRIQDGRFLGIFQVSAKPGEDGGSSKGGRRSYGLMDMSTEEAEQLLTSLGAVMGFALEWCVQGKRWSTRARDLLQGSNVLIGALNDTTPAYSWVESMVPRICGGRRAELYLLDPGNGDLQHVRPDGTHMRIKPGPQHCLAARAVKSGKMVVLHPSPSSSSGEREGSSGTGHKEGQFTARVLKALEEKGAVVQDDHHGEAQGGQQQDQHHHQHGQHRSGGGAGRRRVAAVCCPVRTPAGEVVGALQVTLREEGVGGSSEHVDIDAMEQVSQLLGIAMERLHAKLMGAAKFREREAEREDHLAMFQEKVQVLQEELEGVMDRQEELKGINAELATENEVLKNEAENMARLEEELEEERARVRRLRKERNAILAKHKQSQADKAQQLEMVASSISGLKEEIRVIEAEKDRAVKEMVLLQEKRRREASTTRSDMQTTKEAVEQAKRAQVTMAGELKELKTRLRTAEEEATVLRETLDATTKATDQDLTEIQALRTENEALRTHQDALQKGLKTLARLESYEASGGAGGGSMGGSTRRR